MIGHIITIAKNTFRETMRDRILLSALLVVFMMILFSIFIGSISIEQDIRMITNFSLTVIYLLQMFVAIFVGSMLMYKEIERKTFYLIIPKPIKIESIILGKALGLTFTTFVVTTISTICLYLILFIKGGNIYFVPILVSLLLSMFESVIIVMISILFSSITSPILSAIYTIGFFLVGHFSETMRYIMFTSDSELRVLIIKIAYYILPNLEKFNIRNDVIYEKIPTLDVLLLTLIYALLYILIIFLITKISFKKKEF